MPNPPNELGDWGAVKPFVLDALDALPDQVWFATPDLTRVLFSSKSFEEMYGMPLDELYRDPASPLALTDSDDTGEIARALETGHPLPTPQEHQYTVHRPDGTDRILRLRTIPLLDDDGRMHMLAGVTEDVTDRVAAEREANRLRERSQEILDATSDHVALIDPDDRVMYLNRSFRESLDLRDDGIGRPIAEVLPRREQLLHDMAARVRADGRTRSMAWHERHLDRWLETTMTLVGDDILSWSVDRTERREAEARERQLAEAASRADRLDALGRMAGSIAHDVGNLARLMLAGLDEIRDDLRDGRDTTAALADTTHAAERALAITHQLLAFSRGTEGPPRPVSVDTVLARMRTLIERTLGVDVEVDVVTGARGAHVMSDEARLEQVLLNLATNARTAMPDGGRFVVESAVVDDPTVPGGPAIVRLSAIDTGRGMSAATIRRAFEPFFTTDQVNGTGLGLPSVYSTAVDAGGTAHISSTPGNGTKVTLDMPVVEDSATEPASDILLVDTFGPDSDATLEALTIGGYDVTRMTPSRIVAELDRRPAHYRAVVLDPLVDGGSGGALLHQVTALHPSVPVVLLSGRSSHPEFGGSHTVHFVRPPFGHAELLQTVRTVAAPRGT